MAWFKKKIDSSTNLQFIFKGVYYFFTPISFLNNNSHKYFWYIFLFCYVLSTLQQVMGGTLSVPGVERLVDLPIWCNNSTIITWR